MAEEITRVEFEHNGDSYVAEVGKEFSGRKFVAKNMAKEPVTFPGMIITKITATHIWWEGTDHGWANPFLTGQTTHITRA